MKFAFAALIGAVSAVKLQEEVAEDDLLAKIWGEVSGIIEDDGVIDADEAELLKPYVVKFFDLDEDQEALLDQAGAVALEDGVIEAHEVLDMAAHVAGVEDFDEEDMGHLIFDTLDADGSGGVSLDELADKAEDLEIEIDSDIEEAAVALFEDLDVNEDGEVCKEEVGLEGDSDSEDDSEDDEEVELAQCSDDDSDSEDETDSEDDSEDSEEEVVLAQEDDSEDSEDDSDDEDDFCPLEYLGAELFGDDFVIGDQDGELDLALKIAMELSGEDEETLTAFAAPWLEDGLIHPEELLEMGQAAFGEDITVEDLKEMVAEAAFAAADDNEDGDLCEDEIKAAADFLGLDVSDEDAEFVAAMF